VVFILPEPLGAQAASPRCGVLVHVALEAAVGTEAAPADRAAEGPVWVIRKETTIYRIIYMRFRP
jgi:hypothetical protein